MPGDDIGQEEAWRDLVARMAEPPADDDDPPPWPARENLVLPRPAPGDPVMGPLTGPRLGPPAVPGEDAGAGAGTDPDQGPAAAGAAGGHPEGEPAPGGQAPGGQAPGEPAGQPGPGGTPGPGGAPGPGGSPGPAGSPASGPVLPGRARVIRPASTAPPPPADDDDHYVPPPPPPLPRLDPVAKGAWLGLFGGPGYLLLSVMAGWTVPGWAAFCGVGAFVAGFATLVMRIGDRPPGDSGPGDGAVV